MATMMYKTMHGMRKIAYSIAHQKRDSKMSKTPKMAKTAIAKMRPAVFFIILKIEDRRLFYVGIRQRAMHISLQHDSHVK